jgi:hypothetical protein
MSEKVKKLDWQRQLKAHDRTTKRAMTTVETMEYEERRPSRAEIEHASIQQHTGKRLKTLRRTLGQTLSVGRPEVFYQELK